MGVANGLGQSLTPDGDLAVDGEGIDGLDPHAIEPYGLLEGLGVDLTPSVHLARGIDELAQGDTSAVVTHGDQAVGDGDLDLLASAHDVLVDGVVQHLLEQDIDPIVGVGTIA